MHGKELVIKLFHPIVQNKIKTPAKIEHYCLANAPSTSVRERIGFTVKLLVSLPQGGGGRGRGVFYTSLLLGILYLSILQYNV